MIKQQKEVEKHLIELSKKHRPGRWKPEDYIGAGKSKYKYLNLKVPHIRSASKHGYSFSSESIESQWNIWNQIWSNTPYFEAALSAAHFVNSRPMEELLTHQNQLIGWQKRIDNWALSDELSNCYSRLLETNRTKMLPQFKFWNSSNNPWDRRQSIVGLLFYSRFRTKPLPCQTVLSFVRPLIKDEHYYVQKGIGWTLRECWNLYPEPTLTFMERYAGQIPPAGWTAATEKLPPKAKIRLATLRKKERT